MISLIFDLDGTLVSSTDGIKASLSKALEMNGLKNQINLDGIPIAGPPLKEIVIELVGFKDPPLIDRIIVDFINHYDSVGYMETTAFKNIPEMLKELKNTGFQLFIATNKRVSPTHKILKKLNWYGLFEAVVCIDSLNLKNLKKSDLINHIVKKRGLLKSNIYYIGDQKVDSVAAREAEVNFLFADWDPAKIKFNSVEKKIYQSPLDLLMFLSKIQIH